MGKKVSHGALITALISCPSIKEAAAQCGIAEKTAHAWLRESVFQAELRKVQDALTREAMTRVIGSVGKAVAVLESIMQDEDSTPAPRVSAAKTILEQALKIYDLENIQRRLDALEKEAGINDQ
jgi:hypothetical protein